MRAVNAFLRFLAFILMLVVIIALPLSLLARDVGQLVFDADTIKALVSDSLLSPEFVGQLAQRAISGVVTGAESGDQFTVDEAGPGGEEEGLDMALLGEGLSYLEEDDWIQIAHLISPPDVISETVDQIVDGYIAWLDSDAGFPALVLNIAEWKANMRVHAREVVEIVLAALPACTAEEIAAQALEGLQEGEGLAAVAIPVCRPPEPTYGTLLDNADNMVAGMTQQMPDEIDTQLLQGDSAPEELTGLKDMLLRVRLYVRWAWALVLGVALLGVILAARSWPQALIWAGWPLLLAGGITLLFGFGVQVLAAGGLERLVVAMFRDAPVTLSAIGTTVAAGVFPLVARPLLIQGGVLMALGLASLIGGRAWRDRQEMGSLSE